MTTELLLGLDVGTTFSKAAVVDTRGVELAHGKTRTPWRAVPTGAEIDPRDLAGAAVEAARGAIAAAPPGRIAGVGVTSMAETGALLDRQGVPVADSIVWHDRRGEAEAQRIADALGREAFTLLTGLPISPLCSLSKYLWLRGNLPEARRGVRWLNVAEWIVNCIGGEETAELSLSSRTGWFDLRACAWWTDALEFAGAPEGFLPPPQPAGAPAGEVTDALPEARRAVLTVAGHDHDCAALGAGVVDAGAVFDSCGTAEAFVRAVEPNLSSEDIQKSVAGGVTVGRHVIPGHWALMGGFESGLALRRFADLLGVTEGELERLDDDALRLAEGSEGISVDGVTEERATISGIPRGVTPAHMWRAALEALAKEGNEMLSTIQSVAGPTKRLVVSGGGARGAAARAVRRAILGPFDEPVVTEAGARGAALLGGLAAGIFGDICELPPPVVAKREPVREG